MVGTGKYTPEQIRFIVAAKKQGATNSEIVTAFNQRWLFHGFTTGSVKYVVHKYQDDPDYNGGLTLGADGPQLTVKPFQGPGSTKMMRQAPQAQEAPQMMMPPTRAQFASHMMMQARQAHGAPNMMQQARQAHGAPNVMMPPQHHQSLAPPMVQSQQPQGLRQGFPQAMMSAQQPNASPQVVYTLQGQSSSQTAMHSAPTQGFANPLMLSQQAPNGMNTDELLKLAYSIMSPVQFYHFAKALAKPDGPASANSPQQFQTNTTGMSPQLSQGSSTPGMGTQQFASSPPVGSPRRSQSSSPGNSQHGHGSGPAMSYRSPNRLPTPIMSQANRDINNDLFLAPQHPQGAIYPSTSAPQIYGNAHGMAGHQSWGATQSNMAHQQFQAPIQAPIAPQQAAASAFNQPAIVGHGGPPTTSAPITGASSHPAVNRKELTPYRGIIPPSRTHGQKGQLGMIHRFVRSRDPLASATSPENRVSKKSPKKSPNNSPKKPTVRPQLPLSPISPPEQVIHERAVAAPAFTEVSSQNEGTFGNNLHNSLVASLAEDPMDIVTPEITVGVSELFEGTCLENASVSSMDDDVLFVGENAIATAAKVETPTEEASTQSQGPKHGVDEFFQEIFHACQRKRTLREPEAKTPEDILIDALLADNYTSAEFLALKNNEMSKKSEPVQTAHDETIIDEEPNLDEMTFEEQYLYGIRQGLPNKGYPVGTKSPKETVTKKPAVEEPATKESATKEPAANKTATNESIVNDIFADESMANYLAPNESSVNGITTNESVADYIVTDKSTVDDFATDESTPNNIAANQPVAHQNVMTRFAPTCFDSPYITDEQFRELQMHYLGPYPGSQQAFEEMYLRPHYMSN